MRASGKRLWIAASVGAAALASLAGSASAGAATISVTSVLDPGSGSTCTLRQAIASANQNADQDGCVGSGAYGDDTITFAPAGQGLIQVTSELSVGAASSGTLEIQGAGAVNVTGNNSTRVFHVTSNALTAANAVTISGLEIAAGRVTANFGSGAGILNEGTLTLEGVIVHHNTVDASASSGLAVGAGAGIANELGHLTLSESTIRRNFVTATASGAATAAIAQGGAISSGGSGAMLRIDRSTIEDNGATATFATSTADETAVGGAISIGASSGNQAVIENSTIGPSNLATVTAAGGGTSRGGGIAANEDTSLTADTITGNDATTGGANVSVIVGTTTLENTIVAQPIGAGNCSGSVASAGHNLASDASCNLTGTGDLPNTAAGLLDLGDHGGPTLTRPPAPGSATIDQGVAAGEDFEQRGLERTWQFNIPDAPGGDGTDIGAVEIQGPLIQATNPLGPSADQSPKVIGTVEPGSTVELHAASACADSPLGSGTASEFASPGITPASPLAVGSTTIFKVASFYGTARSFCDASSIAYTVLAPPSPTPDTTPASPSPSAPVSPTTKKKKCKKKHKAAAAKKKCKKKRRKK